MNPYKIAQGSDNFAKVSAEKLQFYHVCQYYTKMLYYCKLQCLHPTDKKFLVSTILESFLSLYA